MQQVVSKKSAAKSNMAYIYMGCLAVFLSLGGMSLFVADRAGWIHHAAPQTHSFVTDMSYYDLPRMTVSVGGGRNAASVSMQISLEVANKDKTILEGYQPRITDRLNGFFSTVSPQEVERLRSLPWLRQEMLRQVNSVGAPVPVHDLLLRQLVIM